MKVYRVAETTLTLNPDCDPSPSFPDYAISKTGFQMESLNYSIDLLHEAAGRGCYRSWDRPNPETATNETYLRHSIIDHQHFSVLEHGSMTVRVEGISRNLLGELVRHRHLSYSFLSTRYVDYSEAPAVLPPIAERLPLPDRDAFAKDLATAAWFTKESYKHWYSRFRDLGFKKKEARTGAREFLLGSMATEGFVSGNVRAWREVVGKRIDPGAAEDIQIFAAMILNNLQEIAPNSVSDLKQ